ncbi:cathepsin K-like, partial [Chironomus tepperi]|uniref:cathepsin K-like n=1 Tax=Chironomus tepperi TaxID=113505 RepID=UPI00391F431F
MRDDGEYPVVPECQLDYLNYSAIGYPSTIKNQGRCGACWAFAASGVCEAALYRKTKKLYKFSEQQMVDCTQNDDFNNFGCRGGRISAGMQYLQAVGAMNESEYQPYSQSDNKSCLQSDEKVVVKIKSFSRLLKVDEEYLKNLLCEVGPVTVAVDGSSRGFQFYSSGIFNDPTCRNIINHAM